MCFQNMETMTNYYITYLSWYIPKKENFLKIRNLTKKVLKIGGKKQKNPILVYTIDLVYTMG